ncbi:hypothetical protein DENSPDRAFT_841791 [Dentipellis sp. KUC8613]|nr:hypothetical protein DENSPDRAFT_841791 [Dentipellis sp. KUC8613]
MPAHRTRDTHSRSLDVTAEVDAYTPTLNIISPTPRAFTFPFNISSPAPSPSNSPFEPDFSQLTFTPPLKKTHTPSSSIDSTASFLSDLSTADSPPAPRAAPAKSRRRRRSTASEINERRPKKGEQDYIKRPENAFILFRRKCCEERNLALDAKDTEDGKAAPTKKQRQADLSKAISQQWKALPHDERQYWEDLAKEKKKEHELLYPHYVYRPQRVKKGKGAAAAAANDKGKGKDGQEGETDADGVSVTMPVPAVTRSGRRAVSAPTPPLAYQQIQIPQLFMPSTPTTPSMVPMTARRDSFAADGFDFASAECLPESTFNQPQGWNPEINGGSDVVPNMFDVPMYGGGAKQDMPLESLMIPQGPMFENMPLTSDSSGPPSPHHGPWTPTHTHGADGLGGPNAMGFLSGHDAGARPSTLEIINLPREAWQAQDELCIPRSQAFAGGAGEQQQQQQFGYQPYAWPSVMWSQGSEPLFNEDFDIGGIPPIELDMPKYDLAQGHGEQPQPPSHAQQDHQDRDPFMASFAFEDITTERY